MNTRATFKDFARTLNEYGFKVTADWPILTFRDLPGVAVNFPHWCEPDDVLTAMLVTESQPPRKVEVGSGLITLLTDLRTEKNAKKENSAIRSTFKDFAQALRTLGDFKVLAQWPVLTFIDLPGVAINFPHWCESDDVLTAVLVIQNQPAREVKVGSDLIRLLTELRAEKKANSTTRREELIKRRTEAILADAKSLVATEFKKLSRDELLAKFREILGLPPEISKEETVHMSDEDAYKNFLTSWNRSTLVQKTEQFILREGHPLNVHREMGGPAATVIRNILVNLMKVPDTQRVEALTQRLLDHYDLRNYQPRLSLVRELLALKVQERALQKALVSSFCPGPVNDGAAALGVVLKRVEAEAEKFASPEEVYLVSASDLEALVSRILCKW